MGNKFVSAVIWTIIGIVVFGSAGWFLLFSPVYEYIVSDASITSEIRLCLRLFLLLFILNTFGVLRLYNSIVNNTRFSIKLREAIMAFNRAVPGLERSMKNLNSSMGNLRASFESLKKVTSENSDKLDENTDKLKTKK